MGALHHSVPNLLKVGISVSLSGQFRVQGKQALTGLQAWAADVNVLGGVTVPDRAAAIPVSVVHHDDASRSDGARIATERLITQDKVDLLLGPYSSVLTNAVIPVAEKYGSVLWNQGGAADGIYSQGHQWVVGILTSASEYLVGLPSLVRNCAPDAGTLAIVRTVSGAFPRVVSSGLEGEAVRQGFETVMLNEYDPGITDFSSILDAVEQAQPDVLVAVGRIYHDLLFAQQLSERRFPLGVAAVVAAPIQQFSDALGVRVEGFIGPSQWEPTGSYVIDYGPSASSVMDSLRRQTSTAVDYPMVQAYASGLVAQRCVLEAGTLDQRALRDAAAGLDFSTFYGRFKIDPKTGKQVGRSVMLVQWQQGHKVVVWPPEQKQGELVYPREASG